jgi:signal transduction histidine kinase
MADPHAALSADPLTAARSYDGGVRAFLRSFWREPRVPDPPRRVWRDWALVALLAPLCIVEVVLREDLPYRWLSFAVAFGGVPLLLWRRTHPLPVVAAVFGAAIVMDTPWILEGGAAPGLFTMVYVLIPAYALFRWGSGREALIGLGIMLVPATLSLVLDFTSVSEAVMGFAIFLLALALGVAVRSRTRERVSRIDAARAHEREALARDLHDTVAHHVSAIAVRAQAGIATAPADPEAAVAALRVIEAEASRTLTEMRTIVRRLRTDGEGGTAPLPRLGDVRGLAGATTPGGAPVHVELHGDEAGVPESVAAAAYRLVQESVTNARRHARRASRIDVTVRADDDAVTVEVTDDGERASGAGDVGFGIVGMVERAEGLGGTCVAGPRAGGGWAVTAVLPLRGASA